MGRRFTVLVPAHLLKDIIGDLGRVPYLSTLNKASLAGIPRTKISH